VRAEGGDAAVFGVAGVDVTFYGALSQRRRKVLLRETSTCTPETTRCAPTPTGDPRHADAAGDRGG